MKEQRRRVLDMLDGFQISYTAAEHPAVETIEEMEALGLEAGAMSQVVKNLFLCDDKKKRFFLISLAKDKTVNLKELREKLNCRPLSFASEARLSSVLGLPKGAVTPFGVLNDQDRRAEVLFDEDIRSFRRVGVHPNDNTATVWLSPEDLERIIRDHGNPFAYIKL